MPTFLFINKMDLAGADRAALLTDLQKSFGACVDLGAEVDLRALRAVGAVGLDADGLREAVAGHAVGEVGKQVRR